MIACPWLGPSSGGLQGRQEGTRDGDARRDCPPRLRSVVRQPGEWQAFSGNSLEQTHIIFTAEVISASSSRKEVHVFISPRSTVEDSKPSYRLIGSTFRRACTIIKGDSIVAQTNLLYKLKKTIFPANDNILVMAMIVTFFVEK
ncbi:unnamed protein product [Miscanthus lutarioriparius]|uniref:Uncharacterized protein n=1 Tax=Miscanthus lutarioriparius TaxID=422564 RepID=A0A811RRZ2_9POAL|nr:unnamed protein product [Miscanthus lutarioriparius]